MNDTMDYLFGPLNKDYCIYFYALSIFGFVYLIITLITSIGIAIAATSSGSKKITFMFWINTLGLCLGYFIFYFQNRLLHTMCSTN